MNEIEKKNLVEWYRKNARPLPWRQDHDPYKIWISETMLQQTTVQTVWPYYEKFLEWFPDLESLAKAQIQIVLSAWAGLGYYSRARNLHQAAQIIFENKKFPTTHSELAQLPGFGPYMSRAVSSIAFNESVGVVDGNVIRVLSRFYGDNSEWWKAKVRERIQIWADDLVQGLSARVVNQAIMDLGAMVCTRTQPQCAFCPLKKGCWAFREGTQETLPRKRPSRIKEIWCWKPQILRKGKYIGLVLNQDQLPFLKKQWVLPGLAQRREKKPRRFDFQHRITHYDIYVSPQIFYIQGKKTISPSPPKNLKWVKVDQLTHWAPASLIKKSLISAEKDSSNQGLTYEKEM